MSALVMAESKMSTSGKVWQRGMRLAREVMGPLDNRATVTSGTAGIHRHARASTAAGNAGRSTPGSPASELWSPHAGSEGGAAVLVCYRHFSVRTQHPGERQKRTARVTRLAQPRVPSHSWGRLCETTNHQWVWRSSFQPPPPRLPVPHAASAYQPTRLGVPWILRRCIICRHRPTHSNPRIDLYEGGEKHQGQILIPGQR